MIVAICTAAATLAFVGLVIAIILSLRSAVRRLDQIRDIAKTVHLESMQLSGELRSFLGTANQTVRSARQQLAYTESLFQSAGELGLTVKQAANSLNKISAALSESAVHHVEQAGRKYSREIGEALEWAEIGYSAWQWLQNKRQSAVHDFESSGRDEGHYKHERRES